MSVANNDVSTFQDKIDEIKKIYNQEIETKLNNLIGICEILLNSELKYESKEIIGKAVKRMKESRKKTSMKIFDKLDNLLK